LFVVSRKEDLYQIASHLEANDIRFKLFYEPDDDMGETALCTEPITDPERRKLFRRYKLWRA
jgi:hypothetical protein